MLFGVHHYHVDFPDTKPDTLKRSSHGVTAESKPTTPAALHLSFIALRRSRLCERARIFFP